MTREKHDEPNIDAAQVLGGAARERLPSVCRSAPEKLEAKTAVTQLINSCVALNYGVQVVLFHRPHQDEGRKSKPGRTTQIQHPTAVHPNLRKAGELSVETLTVLLGERQRLRAFLIGQTGRADTCAFMCSPSRVENFRPASSPTVHQNMTLGWSGVPSEDVFSSWL